ncbi:MAG TPA: T9SS type A sorting domain-containing protein [Chitinophagaceae bacterium]|nr:T9SS type A sorting domain-containing protein [Chitinophagaceae bacterium]
MKLNSTRKHLSMMLVTGICAAALFFQPAIAAEKPLKVNSAATNPGEEEPAKKKGKTKAKTFASLNNSSVKIFPDALKREMHVVAKDNEGKEIDFFVFDVQGTLVQNYKMKAKDHYKISGLVRGTYLYRVFNGDEETASGKFDIR